MTRAMLLLTGLLLAGALGLAATTGGVSASGDEDDPCEWFIDLAEDYAELEILECASTAPKPPPYSATARAYGLLSWDGRIATFDGAVHREGGISWGLDRDEGCWVIAKWLEEQGLDYRPDCFKSRFEGRAIVQEPPLPSSLEFYMGGVLLESITGVAPEAYYEARFTPTFVLKEITIWGMEEEPSFDYAQPCVWFIDLAENYPELEIIECEGEWRDPSSWIGHGLLSWGGRTAAFKGGASPNFDYVPGRGYDFEWALDWSELCGVVPAWLDEERKRHESWQSLPRYEGAACTVRGGAFNNPYHTGVAPGVIWFVGGRLDEPDGRGQAVYWASFFHDLQVKSVHVVSEENELLIYWPGGMGHDLFPPDTSPAPGDTGTGLAPPGYFIPEIAGPPFGLHYIGLH